MGFEMLDLFFSLKVLGSQYCLEMGTTLVIFLLSFRSALLCSVCVLVFQSTWRSRTFIILKDTNLGTGICLISDFLACRRDRKS